ncbi:MAG: caspase family protein [Synergistaceae bacterium]
MFIKPTTTTTTNTTRSTPSDRKLAFCTGINDYPGSGNDLQGCVNDAKEWADLLSGVYGYKVTTRLNKKVSYGSYTEIFGNMIADSRAGDNIVGTYSGHGTNVPDQNGDESDGRDEALCLYDGYLIDDCIREMFKNLHPEATLTFISDSCHSASVTRAFMSTMYSKNPPRIRYMPPEDGFMGDINPNSKLFHPEENMNHILISGCQANEYSYDAYMGGRYHGAMTFNGINILRRYPTITYDNFYKKLRNELPSDSYPQSPSLEGRLELKNKIMFK